jgi:membrane protein YdbS with pleckstrin-like domain
MSRDTGNASGGLGLGTALFLIFLVLKLCNVIDWSWWWVTSPLWISAALTVLIIVGVFLYYYIKDVKLESRINKLRKKNEKD